METRGGQTGASWTQLAVFRLISESRCTAVYDGLVVRGDAGEMGGFDSRNSRPSCWTRPTTRCSLVAALALLFGCNSLTQPPVPQEELSLSATVQSYDAGIEDREGSYDHLILNVTSPNQLARTTLSFRLTPGEVPLDSPVRTAGTKVTFTLDADQVSESKIPWDAVRDFAISDTVAVAKSHAEGVASLDIDEAEERLYELARHKKGEECLKLVKEFPDLLERYFVSGTFLHWAASRDLPELIEYGISKGMEVNAVNDFDGTPLSQAADRDAKDALACLLINGADPNIGRGKYPTAIVDAVIPGHLEIVEMLIDGGADVNASYRRDSGETVNPLSFAEDYGHKEIAALLRRHGAVLPDRSHDPAPPRTFRDDVLDHAAKHIGPVERMALHENVLVSVISVSVHVIEPDENRPYRTLLTTGVSEFPMHLPSGDQTQECAELMIQLPKDWRVDPASVKQDDKSIWPVQWLRMCSHAIHDHGIWLGKGIVLEAPKRVPKDWPFAGFLIAPSGLSKIACDDGRQVTIYTIQPIHQSELDLANQRGIDVLVRHLKAANARGPYDEGRPSAAK